MSEKLNFSRAGETAQVSLIATKKSWIEDESVRQLEKTAQLPGMVAAVGLPDLHPGKGFPVGAVFVSKDLFYPALAGGDIGCGVGLWQTDQKLHKLKLDKLEKNLNGLETPWDGDRRAFLAEHGLTSGGYDDALGTIGGGNHFAELQKVETVFDEDRFSELGLDKKHCQLLVHSGSRGLGHALMRKHWDDHGARSLEVGSDDATNYLEGHDYALQWAIANRSLIAERFLAQMGQGGVRVADVSHNLISSHEYQGGEYWLHRKGAAEADKGPVMLPGSRGTFSYLVEPMDETAHAAWSLAHGAGRRWQRGSVKARIKDRYSIDELKRTELGSRVICEDRELLYDEAPQAYKDIDQVIQDLVDFNLVRPIARFAPLITYKMRKGDK